MSDKKKQKTIELGGITNHAGLIAIAYEKCTGNGSDTQVTEKNKCVMCGVDMNEGECPNGCSQSGAV